MEIDQFQKKVKKPICEYCAGNGLLLHLLSLVGCDVYGVDLAKEGPQKRTFNKMTFLNDSSHPNYQVPIDHIFLISWGPYMWSCKPFLDYITRGGKFVIIIGEDYGGCTNPSYDFFWKTPGWITQFVEIPNFKGVYTKMSINRKL